MNGIVDSFKLLGEAADGTLGSSELEAGGANPKTGFSPHGQALGGEQVGDEILQPQIQTPSSTESFLRTICLRLTRQHKKRSWQRPAIRPRPEWHTKRTSMIFSFRRNLLQPLRASISVSK